MELRKRISLLRFFPIPYGSVGDAQRVLYSIDKVTPYPVADAETPAERRVLGWRRVDPGEGKHSFPGQTVGTGWGAGGRSAGFGFRVPPPCFLFTRLLPDVVVLLDGISGFLD